MTVVIIGGGVMGAATAYMLAKEHGVYALVLERDASYACASSALSVSAIRQQFSTAINIRLSQASLAFYRQIGDELAIGDERPSIGLVEPGYLYLASAAGASVLRANHAVQRDAGVSVALLTVAELSARYPWLDTTGVVLGSLGLSTATSGEGWFDGYSVLQAFRRAAIAHGARFVEEDAITLEHDGGTIRAVMTHTGTRHPVSSCVVTAGAWSAPIVATAGFALPIRARKRDVFAITAAVSLPDCPLVIDPSGYWFRPERAPGHFLCGAPPRHGDPDDAPLDGVDHGLFTDWIWPRLAERVPAFDALRVTSAWSGYYEYNTLDQNGLVGRVPDFSNLYVGAGFSGHGLQQAPAVGRALAELIAEGTYRTLDLSPLGVERVRLQQPFREQNII